MAYQRADRARGQLGLIVRAADGGDGSRGRLRLEADPAAGAISRCLGTPREALRADQSEEASVADDRAPAVRAVRRVALHRRPARSAPSHGRVHRRGWPVRDRLSARARNFRGDRGGHIVLRPAGLARDQAHFAPPPRTLTNARAPHSMVAVYLYSQMTCEVAAGGSHPRWKRRFATGVETCATDRPPPGGALAIQLESEGPLPDRPVTAYNRSGRWKNREGRLPECIEPRKQCS